MKKIAGMTGTAETEAAEFNEIYGLSVMIIPTNKPCLRIDRNDVVYKTRREKFAAVLREIEAAHKKDSRCWSAPHRLKRPKRSVACSRARR